MSYKMLKAVEPSLEPPEDEVICFCSKCGGEIYKGETFGEEECGKFLCSDCIDDMLTEMPLEMRFSIMGYKVKRG